MDEPQAEVIAPTPDEALALFEKSLDARDEPVETPKAAVETPEAPESPDDEAEQPEKPAEPVKIDRRTKEGRKASIQAEIDAAVREREETRRELAALKAERDAIKTPKPVAAPVSVDSDAEPDPTDLTKYPDGQFDRKFFKDQARWEARQELKAENDRRAAQQAEQTWSAIGREQIETLKTKVAETEKDPAAYFAGLRPEIAELAPSGSLTPEGRKFVQTPAGKDLAVRCAIMDSVIKADHSKALLDHLNDHPEVFQRLLTLPPDDLFRSMGKLDATLGTAKATARPQLVTSNAKPPIKPLGSDASAADDETLSDDLPVEEFIRRGNSQQARSRR